MRGFVWELFFRLATLVKGAPIMLAASLPGHVESW
jgi:hypothetical protein